jgi:uncharacterized protein GlcG (DUF336 family)
MKNNGLSSTIEKLIDEMEALIPGYMNVEEDRSIANGNVSVCIIDESGKLYGRMYGTNKIRCRETFRNAWVKASQVWITGMKTGEFERKIFSGEISDSFGISMPDMIGWEGGQPIELSDGTKLSAGFSGFRGVTDLEIVVKALIKINEPK